MMNKNKLVWLSDSALSTTGYATITRNVLNRLKDEFDCIQLAHNYFGQPLKPPIKFDDDELVDFNLIGMGMEQYSKDLIMPTIRKNNTKVFGILLDTFMTFPWLLDMDFAPAKSFFYFPSDGGGQLPNGCEQILKKVTLPIAMAKFGQQQAKEIYNIDCEYIPHGVDSNIFYLLSYTDKQQLKAKWGLHGKYVVGVVARNQGRKMLDRTLKAFKIFCIDKPDAVLLLHTDPQDRAAVFDLNNMIIREGLQNRVIFTGMSFYNSFDYKEMNDVYNLMDVFFLSTSGEGFGVPLIEAMACAIPIVATDYTTTKEIVCDNNCGLAVNIQGMNKTHAELEKEGYTFKQIYDMMGMYTITGSWNVERAVMDCFDAAKKLTFLYKNIEEAKKMGENGLKAVQNEYSWDVVMQKWKEVLKRLIEE